jgi:hypothetical protein
VAKLDSGMVTGNAVAHRVKIVADSVVAGSTDGGC